MAPTGSPNPAGVLSLGAGNLASSGRVNRPAALEVAAGYSMPIPYLSSSVRMSGRSGRQGLAQLDSRADHLWTGKLAVHRRGFRMLPGGTPPSFSVR